MMHVKLIERGPVPRKLKKAYGAAQKAQWLETAKRFHVTMRDDRFSEQHAREAGYLKRKGENLPRGSKRYKRSYTGRKEARFGHTRPLEFSGESRRAARMATLSSTSKQGKAAYPGLRKFNFRHAKSQINMSAEFRRVLQREAQELARHHDAGLTKRLNSTP